MHFLIHGKKEKGRKAVFKSNEAMRRYAGRPKKPKKSPCPKRLSMAEKAVQQMRTRGMNDAKTRSWFDLNEDDSEFMPTTQTTGSQSYNVLMACVEISTMAQRLTIMLNLLTYY